MINVKEELKKPTFYIVLVFGLLLGAGILALIANYRMRNMTTQQLNSLGIQNTQSINGTTTAQVSTSYQKALENPDKPFTDERGVVHPPLGTATTKGTTTVSAPPIGGTTPIVPVAPKAPVPVIPVTPINPIVTKTATTTR